MISQKMIKMTEGGSAIRAMFEEGKRLAEKFGKENVFDFSIGNPNIPAPEMIKNEIVSIAENTDPMELHGYMSNAGYPFVRKAVADDLNARFATNYGEENIIMTVGAAGGLNIVLKTLLNPGDEVLVFSPYFLEYGNYVSNYDGVLKAVPASDEDGFQPDPNALCDAITAKTKAVIINNPNNPTGVIYSADKIAEIAAVLNKKQVELGTSIYIISDEPYRDLAYDGAEVPFIPNYYNNTIVCYSWSKSLSLPGERIGYVAVPSAADDASLILSAAVIANRILGFVNAPALQQRIVAACLNEKTNLEAYDANRKSLYNGLTAAGFEAVYPSGAFYMWVKAPDGDDKAFAQRAKKYNILFVPGSSFACAGYVRIAYCVSNEMIKRSLSAFKKLGEEYGL